LFYFILKADVRIPQTCWLAFLQLPAEAGFCGLVDSTLAFCTIGVIAENKQKEYLVKTDELDNDGDIAIIMQPQCNEVLRISC
jgi:hypothetical protein